MLFVVCSVFCVRLAALLSPFPLSGFAVYRPNSSLNLKTSNNMASTLQEVGIVMIRFAGLFQLFRFAHPKSVRLSLPFGVSCHLKQIDFILTKRLQLSYVHHTQMPRESR